MRAMVLAAGQGQRLRPITDRIPKPLVPVAGKPMIEYPLRLLRHYGICEVVINLHHLGDQIESYLGDGKKLGLEIVYSKEKELLGTGGGLFKAKSFLADGTFLVINTDVIIDLSIEEVLAYHAAKKATATLVLRPDVLADQYGSMEIDSAGRIHRFLDTKTSTTERPSGQKLMFTGVQVLEPQIFDYMESSSTDRKFSTTMDTYPRMLLAGEALYGFRFDGFWQDLGTESRIQDTTDKLTRGSVKLHYL
ncbi:MAG TPA: NDP-sugar synthase [Candidatus Binatia bacterium]|nr:NDP-sugar synthase [Candidatus Binatia bacterium]